LRPTGPAQMILSTTSCDEKCHAPRFSAVDDRPRPALGAAGDRHTGRNIPSTFRGRTSTPNEIKDLAGLPACHGGGTRYRQLPICVAPYHDTARRPAAIGLESHGAPRSPERDHLGDLEPPYRPGGRRCGHRFLHTSRRGREGVGTASFTGRRSRCNLRAPGCCTAANRAGPEVW
jgi:hypothetical protein